MFVTVLLTAAAIVLSIGGLFLLSTPPMDREARRRHRGVHRPNTLARRYGIRRPRRVGDAPGPDTGHTVI